MDLNLLDGLENRLPPKSDPELESKVSEALDRLEPALRELIRMRFYEGVSTREMAGRLDRPEKEIVGMIYEAKRQLRIQLAEFVNRRWGLETASFCGICAHPKRATIEKILKFRSRNESWKKTTERVFRATGEKFHPPQVLKAHLKHMRNTKEGNNG
ncbi:MAG: hypothetical protein JSW64_09010 [Candidatus Zixiibacteriota bacterium]|nr:MAG: hypothetical protein JSW64_09010 [candidate division Zixibacteria bacterium]